MQALTAEMHTDVNEIGYDKQTNMMYIPLAITTMPVKETNVNSSMSKLLRFVFISNAL